jgi:hypothetical protein
VHIVSFAKPLKKEAALAGRPKSREETPTKGDDVTTLVAIVSP